MKKFLSIFIITLILGTFITFTLKGEEVVAADPEITSDKLPVPDTCTIIKAIWEPAGEQKDGFFREKETTASILVKTKNCLKESGLNFSIWEADTLVKDLADDVLYKSGLENKKFTIPTDNFKINIVLGEEACEDGLGYECDLYFQLKHGTKILYDSEGQTYGNLYYECDGSTCLENAKFLSITELGTDDKPIDVSPVTVLTNSTTYTMLAPIGDITCMDSSGRDPKCIKNDIGAYLNFIFKFGIGLCAALAVVMLIINGIQYMGDESIFGKTESKKKMLAAIGGLLIALGSWALLNTINPDLVGTKLNIDAATVDITSSREYRLAETQDTPGAKVFKRTSYYDQIKKIATANNIPHCLLQVAIQRESGGVSSVGHDEDVPSVNVGSRKTFIASGKKSDGTTFTPGNTTDPRIIDRKFINTDNGSPYTKAPNTAINELGLDWRFSHSIGMFGVTFGPNHINPSGAKAIYSDSAADISRATNMMKDFYNKCNKNIDGTWRAYNSGSCTGNNAFTNKETIIRVDLYNQCLKQDN